jgi:hypothetical protein
MVLDEEDANNEVQSLNRDDAASDDENTESGSTDSRCLAALRLRDGNRGYPEACGMNTQPGSRNMSPGVVMGATSPELNGINRQTPTTR